jgi:V/A-type H+/Na+-transporting ATPase subunit E
MPQEQQLDSLLEKIQQDGVEKANARAEAILDKAEKQAAAIVNKAENDAARMREAAEQERRTLVERGTQALEQAARDVTLSLEASVNSMVSRLVESGINDALSGDTLGNILVRVVDSYAGADKRNRDIQVAVAPADRETLLEWSRQKLSREIRKGIAITSDDSVISGFRIQYAGDHVEHNFTGPAIAEALSRLLRPGLANIVRGTQSKDNAQTR